MKYIFFLLCPTAAQYQCPRSYLGLTAVALLPLLHVAVPALLTTVENLDLGHVVQTHAHTFLQAGSEVLLTACAEHCRERIPVKSRERDYRRGNRRKREMNYFKNCSNFLKKSVQ